jgi:hypothetical protein
MVGVPPISRGHKKHEQNHVNGSKGLKLHLCPQALVHVGLGDPDDNVNVGRLTTPKVIDANPSCEFIEAEVGGGMMRNSVETLLDDGADTLGSMDDEGLVRGLPPEGTTTRGVHGAGVNVA